MRWEVGKKTPLKEMDNFYDVTCLVFKWLFPLLSVHEIIMYNLYHNINNNLAVKLS